MSVASLESISQIDLWQVIPVLALSWLAGVFARTLRAGQIPLIERIARVSIPGLSPVLCRYTRRLTAAWCAYFLVAAMLSLTLVLPFGSKGALIWMGSLLLFLGEHQVRIRLFPDQDFPGLWQQVRDTWHVWRPGP